MSTSDDHRLEAGRCRRLSRGITDLRTRETLERLAQEHDQAASLLDANAERLEDE